MENYAYIIDKVIKTQKTRDLVRKMIPIMIGWAIGREANMTYKDMNRKLGYARFMGIGRALGRVDDELEALREVSGKTDIPTLNALCKNSTTKLPADGFSYVYSSYKTMSPEEKILFVDGLNKRAFDYEHWDWVMNVLGLLPASEFTEEEIDSLSIHTFGGGGEGAEHKALKEYIKSHPEELGIEDVIFLEDEHVLPSGDRLDVYFSLKDGTHVAVEVKPSNAPEQDVSRGIFQCIKYEATMTAERRLRKQGYRIKTMLALGAEMSSFNTRIAEDLGVYYRVIRRK